MVDPPGGRPTRPFQRDAVRRERGAFRSIAALDGYPRGGNAGPAATLPPWALLADVMPLDEENPHPVKAGLRQPHDRRPGTGALEVDRARQAYHRAEISAMPSTPHQRGELRMDNAHYQRSWCSRTRTGAEELAQLNEVGRHRRGDRQQMLSRRGIAGTAADGWLTIMLLWGQDWHPGVSWHRGFPADWSLPASPSYRGHH